MYNILVRNVGIRAAEAVMCDDRLDTSMVEFVSCTCSQGDFLFDGGLVRARLGTLAPGQEATVTVTVRVISAGNLVNVVVIPTQNNETVTGNNNSTATVTVPCESADLTGFFKRPGVTVRNGRDFVHSWFFVRNDGVLKSPKTTVNFYLSNDGVLDDSDILLRTVKIPALKPGKQVMRDLFKTVRRGTASGKQILALIDSGGQVSECIKLNNIIATDRLP